MPPSGAVLFINKSAKSKTLTRSEGTERKEIYCHVQQLPVSKTEHKALVLCWDSCMIYDQKLQSESRYPSRQNVDKDSSRSDRKQAKGRRTAKTHDEGERMRFREPDQALVSIMSLGASKLDPLSCSVVPIDERMTAVLKIFCSSMTNKIFTVKSWAHASLRRILTYASDAPELLYALLCATTRDMYSKSAGEGHDYSTMYFKGQAIAHLQRSIDVTRLDAKGPSVATLRAVCTLLYLACIQGELDVARQHHKALQEMVQQVKDIEATPLAMRTSLVIPTLFCSAILCEPPLQISIADSIHDDETDAYATELLTRFDHDVLLNGRPSRFSNPATEALLGAELWDIVARIHEIEHFNESSSSCRPAMTPQGIQTLFADRMSLAHTLQPRPFDDLCSPEQHIIRTALYLSVAPLNAANNIMAAFKTSLTAHILPCLKRSDLSNMWFPCLDLFLWVLCITAWVFDGEDEKFEWIAEHVLRTAKVLGIRTKVELEELLRGFVYPRRQVGGTVERLWERIREVDNDSWLRA